MFFQWLSVFIFLLPGSSVFLQDNERIMQVLLNNGQILSQGMFVYTSKNQWFLPLEELIDILQLGIELSYETKTAQGFIIEQSNPFELDINSCTYKIKYHKKNYDCSAVLFHQDQIYVESSVLEVWFPLTLNIRPFHSHIVIVPLEKFPVQLSEERKHQYPFLPGASGDEGKWRYTQEDTPPTFFDGPFVHQQLSLSNSQKSGRNHFEFAYYTKVSSEILGVETKSFIQTHQDQLTQWQLTFSKKDPEGKMLGPLRATSVHFFDISVFPMKNVSHGGSGRGFQLSSYPLYAVSNFDQKDFEGPLLPEYDVELYHNDILVGRFQNDQSGRYLFKGIPLFYGRNDFTLVFYGPRGQQRKETLHYFIHSSLLKPKEFHYFFGFSDFSEKKERYFLQFDKNIFETVNLRAGLQRFRYQEDRATSIYGMVSLATFFKNVVLGSSVSKDFSGGHMFDVSSKFSWKTTNLNLSHERFFDYQSEIFNQEGIQNQTSLELGIPLFTRPLLGTNWILSKANFKSKPDATRFTNRLFTNMGWAYFQHQVNYQWEDPNSFVGTLDTFFVLWSGQLNAGFEYTRNDLQQLRTFYKKSFFKNNSLYLSISKDMIASSESATHTRASLSQQFERVALSLDFGIDTKKNVSALLAVTSSFGFDRRFHQLYFKGDDITDFGAASVLVFLDKDYNNEMNGDDVALPNIEIRAPQASGGPWATDSLGRVLLTHLPAYQPVDVVLVSSSLRDPYYQSHKEGIRIYPRVGRTASLNFPVVIMGELGGMVESPSGRLSFSIKKISVELLDSQQNVLQTLSLDSEGSFLFNRLKTGYYLIRLKPEVLKKLKLKAEPAHREVWLSAEHPVFNNMDFVLKLR